jgi:hypothetical protein
MFQTLTHFFQTGLIRLKPYVQGYSGWLFIIALMATAILSLIPISGAATGNDKTDHLLGFFTLMFLWGISPWRPNVFIKAAILVLYGIGIEIAQSFFPYRMFSWYDWIADSVGVFVALLLCFLLKYLWKEAQSD